MSKTVTVKFKGEFTFSCEDTFTDLDIYETVQDELLDIRREHITDCKYEVEESE